MTKKIHVHLIDDLDASEASETLRFEVDGRPYEIDLSSHNAQKFRAEIAPYIRHARRVVTHVRRRRWHFCRIRASEDLVIFASPSSAPPFRLCRVAALRD